MARLFGLIGNRADLAGRVLEVEREALQVPESLIPAGPISWGIGFYQGGELLLRRRPSDERRNLDIATLTQGLRTDLLIGQVRASTTGALRTENTHPFRYREWLFAHTGSLEHYAQIRPRLLDSIPEFLRKNIRGDTDSEILFHIVLSFLHDAGQLQQRDANPRTIAAALSSLVALTDQLVAEEGASSSGHVNILITNGEVLLALHRDAKTEETTLPSTRMAMRVVHGRNDLDALIADDPLRRVRLTDPGVLRFALIASDFAPSQPPGQELTSYEHEGLNWVPIPSRSIVVMTRDAAPQIESF